VLSLWKLRVGAEAYYLSQVARGIDDYYSGAGETEGRWFGTAADILNLPETVDGDDLRAILAGLVPGTGLTPNGKQLRPFKNRVPGFDLTFSAPKSVSVMYAFANPIVRAEITDAVDTAITDAVSWLEREACFVRRGSNNRRAKVGPFHERGTRRLPGVGFIAAGFRHRTSRAGDPQLHTHVLIANLTRGPDGRWTALDGHALYRSKLAAGVVFQTVLRDELTCRLGVGWRPVRDHVADIAGIPQCVLAHFSKRRNEIEGELERTGHAGPAAADRATLATRPAKVQVDQETLDERWRADGASIGFGHGDIDQLLRNTRTRDVDLVLRPDTLIATRVVDRITGEVHEKLLTLDKFALTVAWDLPERSATVTRLDAQNAVADHLLGDGGARILERLTDFVLAHPELVLIPQSRAATQAGWEQRWTTRRMIAIEREVIDLVAPTHSTSTALDPLTVEQTLGDFGNTLGHDQADTVRRLCTQGLAVEVVIGRAGTGKTYTMNAVRHVFSVHGHRLVGVCPTGRAARELADGAGIDAFTVPRLFNHAELRPGDVLVVDEAGMCGTIDLHRILTHTRVLGVKTILVGDHLQLPEITAGGGFRAALAHVGGRRCELTINRRQRNDWEHAALDHLRHGDLSTFWNTYRDHDRIHLFDTVEHLHAEAVEAWWNHHASGANAHLIAGTRAEARLLNRLARHRADTAGFLTGEALEIHDRSFQVGDRIVLLANAGGQIDLDTQHRCRVDNGMIATITRIDHRTGSIDITVTGSHRQIRLDAEYTLSGAVDHGYATTIHKAQGVTCDHIHVVGPAGLYREAAYVSLSRARHSAHLYATTRQAATVAEPTHTTGIPLDTENIDDPESDLTATLAATRAKHFITMEQPDIDRIAHLANACDLGELIGRLRRVRTVTAELIDAGFIDPSVAAERLELAERHRGRMVVGGRVNARDWDNVGIVTRLHDTIGHATVRFTSDTGAVTHRQLPWHLLAPIDHPDEIELTELAAEYLENEAARISGLMSRWETALVEHDSSLGDASVLQAAIAQRREQLARALRSTPPDWLRWWAGDRPTDPTKAIVYDDLVADIAHWRDTHRIPGHAAGYGPRPTAPDDIEAWTKRNELALASRQMLRVERSEPPRATSLDPVAIRERVDELDALIDTAPADQRHIVGGLLNRTREPLTDIAELLRIAEHGQQARRDWILEHWPHIVEHHELTKLESQLPPLAHWPTIDSPPTIPCDPATPSLTPGDSEGEGRDIVDSWLGRGTTRRRSQGIESPGLGLP